MPVIVIGADTALGEIVVDELRRHDRDIRAFVTDPAIAAGLRSRGVRVALGDASDGSHVSSAAKGCFSAVVVAAAAWDDRPRSFTDSPEATISAWASALDDASIARLILLEDDRLPSVLERFTGMTAAVVAIPTASRSPAEVAAEVARVDDLDSLAEV